MAVVACEESHSSLKCQPKWGSIGFDLWYNHWLNNCSWQLLTCCLLLLHIQWQYVIFKHVENGISKIHMNIKDFYPFICDQAASRLREQCGLLTVAWNNVVKSCLLKW